MCSKSLMVNDPMMKVLVIVCNTAVCCHAVLQFTQMELGIQLFKTSCSHIKNKQTDYLTVMQVPKKKERD